MRISGFLSGPYWFIRLPVVSAVWYVILTHLLLQPFSTIAIIVSSAIIAFSVIKMNGFYLGMLSPIPMTISLIYLHFNYDQITTFRFAVGGFLWIVCWIIFMIVMVRLGHDRYYFDIRNRIIERQ